MKQVFGFIVLLLLFLPIILYARLIDNEEDFEERIAVEKYERNEKIEELEKRIRILETDVNILQYGFESEIEKND